MKRFIQKWNISLLKLRYSLQRKFKSETFIFILEFKYFEKKKKKNRYLTLAWKVFGREDLTSPSSVHHPHSSSSL